MKERSKRQVSIADVMWLILYIAVALAISGGVNTFTVSILLVFLLLRCVAVRYFIGWFLFIRWLLRWVRSWGWWPNQISAMEMEIDQVVSDLKVSGRLLSAISRYPADCGQGKSPP
jgi:hypothetical protein